MSMHLGFCLDHLPDALTLKRMTRSSLCLTVCVGLALADPTAAFLGPNIFLIGTTAIYLYPKSTVGSQVTSTFIGYLGFLLGLAWYNVVCRHVLSRRKGLTSLVHPHLSPSAFSRRSDLDLYRLHHRGVALWLCAISLSGVLSRHELLHACQHLRTDRCD